MLRHATSSSSTSVKPVDYFRPLIVDVSVEYELPKEVAPPPGSAPLLIIHPSAYYPSRKQATAPTPAATSLLSPAPSRSIPPTSFGNLHNSSSNSASVSNPYFLRSANNVYGQIVHPQPGNPARGTSSSYSTTNSSSVSRSRSMSLAVGAGRRQTSNNTTSTTTTTTCTDRSCDQCYVQPQLMELDLTPSKATSTTTSSKRLRRDRENQMLLLESSSSSSSHQPQPLNLSAANMYLGPSLAYTATGGGSATTANGLSNPLYNRKHSSSGVSSSGQNGIFQMINNVYAQQQVVAAQSERLMLKEQGPKGSGSDSGVCSENESDVSPSTNNSNNHNNNNNNHSRRSLFAHDVGSSTAGCYCCCCPHPSGSDSSRSNSNKTASSTSSSSSTVKSSRLGRSSRSSKSQQHLLSNNSTALPPPQLHQHHHHPHYSSLMGLSSSTPMDSSPDVMMIVPMDSSPAASYRHAAKWFVPPTSADFGRWFQV